jgi:transposase
VGRDDSAGDGGLILAGVGQRRERWASRSEERWVNFPEQRWVNSGERLGTLLSNGENLTLEGRAALKTLLAAHRRLHTAYLLKESFGQLCDYQREGWARRFFEHWRDSLQWQRLPSYQRFTEMVERHWEGEQCRLRQNVVENAILLLLHRYVC